jgi:hypothetical protein
MLKQLDTPIDDLRVQRDQDRFQGYWVSAPGSPRGELVVNGNQFRVCLGDRTVYEGKFVLDPVPRRPVMSLQIEEGPELHRGKVAHAIYAFDENHLIWSPNTPGLNEPPGFFPPLGDHEQLCIVFRRTE